MQTAQRSLPDPTAKRLALLLLAAAGCLFAAWIAQMNFVMHDMYHELALVREAMLRGELPLDNPFAFTPTVYPSVHHEWAMGLLLYGFCISTGWGLMGLTILRWMLILGIVSATYMTARRRGASPIVFALAALLILPIAWVGFGTLRAQLVTLLFTAVQLRLVDEDRRGRRGWVLMLLPLWFVWVNIHAGFLVGAGLLAIDTFERVAADLVNQWRQGRLGERRWLMRRLVHRYWHRVGLLIAAAATLGLTPYGAQYAPYVLHAVRLPRPEIAEWGPLWTTYNPGLTLLSYLMTIVLTTVAVVQLGWRRAIGTLSLIVTAYLALRHIRHGSIYGVVWMCYAPPLLSRCKMGPAIQAWICQRQRAVQRGAVAAIVGSLAYFFYVGGWYTVLPVQSAEMGTGNQPVGVVEYLKENHFRGRLQLPFGAGAYVMWHMYPDVLISIDGRYEVGYPPELLDEHRAFYRGEPGWEQMLDRYPSDAVVVPVGSPIVDAMQSQLHWRLSYQDDAYLLMTPPDSPIVWTDRDRRGETLPQNFL
ncbi:hypothetical protein [Rosistilla oblonga]|uniref:hypothetical protein n=1 Tax=Rosistilla oblonga TaxID=2527990 RepID=UPI003A976CCC